MKFSDKHKAKLIIIEEKGENIILRHKYCRRCALSYKKLISKYKMRLKQEFGIDPNQFNTRSKTPGRQLFYYYCACKLLYDRNNLHKSPCILCQCFFYTMQALKCFTAQVLSVNFEISQ